MVYLEIHTDVHTVHIISTVLYQYSSNYHIDTDRYIRMQLNLLYIITYSVLPNVLFIFRLILAVPFGNFKNNAKQCKDRKILTCHRQEIAKYGYSILIMDIHTMRYAVHEADHVQHIGDDHFSRLPFAERASCALNRLPKIGLKKYGILTKS